jgi:adenylate cyclase
LKKTVIGLLLGLGCAIAALLLGRLPFLRTVELKTYDWRMRATADPASARHDIVLVDIDEKSLRAMEPLVGRWPWPREIHSYLLDFLARGPAVVVAVDVLFTERDRRGYEKDGVLVPGADSDKALAESTAAAGMVVHVADAVQESAAATATPLAPESTPLPHAGEYRLDDSVEARPVLTPPIPEIARASRAIGHNFVVVDPDGTLRRYVPFIRHGRGWMPSLGMAAALVALHLRPGQVRLDDQGLWLGDRFVPLVQQEIPSFYGERRTARRQLVRFVGGPVHEGKPTYARYSFYDLFYAEQQLLSGEPPDRAVVNPTAFARKIVVVGTTAPALHDVFSVPMVGKMAGAQIHAAAIDDVLSRRALRPARWISAALVVVATSLALGIAGVFLGPWVAISLALAGGAAVVTGLTVAFGRGLWFPLVDPLSGLALATFTSVTYQYVVEGRQKRQVKQMFSRYVSRDVCEQLIADPTRARLGGTRREMSVLFSDIRGFTSVSERGEPEEIVSQLNEYFSRMVPLVFAHKGTLDKFVGDMIMALFGAPLADDAHADHAVETALRMVEELHRLNADWAAAGRPTLDIGIGINSGAMVAGNIGSEAIMSYTVIGDNVNLGSRLESLNKTYGTRVIISDATRQRLKGRYDMRPLGAVTVKGKTQPVDIFEVVAARPPGEAALRTKQHVGDAVPAGNAAPIGRGDQ